VVGTLAHESVADIILRGGARLRDARIGARVGVPPARRAGECREDPAHGQRDKLGASSRQCGAIGRRLLSGSDGITISVSDQDGITVLAVGGDVDVATVGTLDTAIADALAHQPAALVVDMTSVDFLASAGLQALVATQQKIGAGGGFAVVADGPATSRPIQLTGLDQIFSLYPTLADATAALKDRT
jgi:anti-sigma B factor antagonist